MTNAVSTMRKLKRKEVSLDDLRATYKEWLFTESGKKLSRDAFLKLQEWRKGQTSGSVEFQTDGVNPNVFCKEIRDNMELIKITGVGMNNLCHTTAELFEREHSLKRVSGYNITSCPCGKSVGFEFHSVNKENGSLCDFTNDFNNETEKWFLPLKTELRPVTLINIFSANEPIFINYGCKCKINWNNSYESITETQLLRKIKMIETSQIKEWN